MASVDECLREASDCVRHAEQCADEGDQAVFMLMAKSWMRLAVQIDEVHPSPSLADDGEELPGEAGEHPGLSANSGEPDNLIDAVSPGIQRT